MKRNKRNKNSNDLCWKKLEKKGRKARKARGLSNKGGSWSRGEIGGKDHSEGNTALFKVCVALEEKVNNIRSQYNGIPEDIDRKCIEETGLNLQTYINYFHEFVIRAVLHEQGQIEDPLGYFDTIGTASEGSKAEYFEVSEEEHKHFLKCFEINTDKKISSMEFQSWLLQTSFKRGGRGF